MDIEIVEFGATDAFAQMNAAHGALLLSLVTTLVEAGALEISHYEGNIRIAAEARQRQRPGLAADILSDFANQLSRIKLRVDA